MAKNIYARDLRDFQSEEMVDGAFLRIAGDIIVCDPDVVDEDALDALASSLAADMAAGLATKAPLVHTHDDRYYTEAEIDGLLGSLPAPVLDHGDLTGLDIDDHPQYHTDARALTWLGTRSTSDMAEGSRLYYTDSRADVRASAAIAIHEAASDPHPQYLTAAEGSAVYSAASHTHTASDVTTGVLSTARLGTGTANGGTILYGDGTWAAPPTGYSDAQADARIAAAVGVSVAAQSHTHTIANVTGLQAALDAKGAGTVTSVGLSVPGVLFSVAGSPVTASGTVALSLLTQAANTILAGPTSGGAATPTMRALVAADLPAILPVVDTTAIAKGSADPTKLVRLEVDGLTTGTTRVLTVRDEDLTLIGYTSAGLIKTSANLGVGSGVTLSGSHVTAAGELAEATSDYSTAFGYNARGRTAGAAFGANALASGNSSVAFGPNSVASSSQTVAILGTASNPSDIAIGLSASASGSYSIAIGQQATAAFSFSVGMGYKGTPRASGDFAFSGYDFAPRILLQRQSSTGTIRDLASITTAAIDNTDATRKYRVDYQSFDTAARTHARGWADGTDGRFALAAPASAPTDAHLANGQVSFYLDEAGANLKVRVKYSDGTLKAGTLTLI